MVTSRAPGLQAGEPTQFCLKAVVEEAMIIAPNSFHWSRQAPTLLSVEAPGDPLHLNFVAVQSAAAAAQFRVLGRCIAGRRRVHGFYGVWFDQTLAARFDLG